MKQFFLATVLIITSFSFGVIAQTTKEAYFIPVWTGNGVDHMNFYVLSATLDDIDLQPGDEIAAFDGDYCVGAAAVTEVLVPGENYLSFVASKNDATLPDINGYTPGNEILFRIWDASEGKEIENIEVDYLSGTGIFSIGGTVSFNLTALSTVEQVITLQEGWNIISFFHLPENTSLMDLLQPLIDNGTLIKVQDETGAAIEYVEPIGWVDNIQDFDPTEGYKIKVSGDVDLITEGLPIISPVEIPLVEGWNIISYPLNSEQSTQTLLADLITDGALIKVQDETGAAIENVVPIGWVFNIPLFKPGEGYKIKVSKNTSIVFEEPSAKSTSPLGSSGQVKSTHFTTVWSGNGLDHMNFYITKATIANINMQPSDEIAVFDGDYCVGVGILTEEIIEGENYLTFVASKNDATPPDINGYTPGNSISFRLWDHSEQQEIHDVETIYLSGGSVFVVGGTSSLKVNGIPNEAPIADAGEDQIVNEGDLVTLDGSGSTDPEEEPLTYHWIASELITLSDSTLQQPQFTAPEVVADQDFVFYLVVKDGYLMSEQDTVVITVLQVNKIPVITGQNELTTPEETPKDLTLADLVVVDNDNTYPDDFTLAVVPGDHYSVNEHTITPETDFYGDLTVPVKVSDGLDESEAFNLTLTVTNVNDAPSFTSEPVTEITAGTQYTYTITTEDPDLEDVLQIELSETAPDWLSLTDHSDGTATLSGDPSSSDIGNYEILISLTDGLIAQPVTQTFTLSVVTGIFDPENRSLICIYPNPADQFIHVPLGTLHGEVKLEIFSVLGEKVFNRILENPGSHDILLNISTFAEGSYILIISDQDNVFYGKFVIQ